VVVAGVGAGAEGDHASEAVGVGAERRGVVLGGHELGDEWRDGVRRPRVASREGRPAGGIQWDGDDVVEAPERVVDWWSPQQWEQ
jgi:hypothetical protein